MGPRSAFVGIDLGTTNSTAAVFDGETVHLVRNAQGTTLTPSVVRIDAKGRITVGGRARPYLGTDPENTRSEFKRLMGSPQLLAFPAAGVSKKPEELAAEVLRSLREDVREQLGFAPSRAVVSVPALFELPQNAATAEAARLAGFERVELVQEPVASALAAGWTTASASETWLVYDLGGGTFDASLLESREGLLRVVGHDGDNFLGGRDVDAGIVEWALGEIESERGRPVSRADAANAATLRKLRAVAEEVKMELTRAKEASLVLAGAVLDAEAGDVDLSLSRDVLEALVAPLVTRTIAVCRRLLARHGVSAEQLARVVLVGGPTVMPIVRAAVKEAFGAPFGEGLDPMTLVAQGAALSAASLGLDGRPAEHGESEGVPVWLQYPALSADTSPHVVGRVGAGGAGGCPARLRLVRADGAFETADVVVDLEGGFVVSVELAPRRPNVFRFQAVLADGTAVRLRPAAITIVHGLTLGDPPLSRTIGVALADDTVRAYFERGMPLPARRTFTHHAIESIAKGAETSVLQIPIVQGELERAHLCRLVGTLRITGAEVTATIPAGARVEVTLELDRGGRLFARALVPATGQVFEEVAHLLVPEAIPEALEASLRSARERITEVRTGAFRENDARTIRSLGEAESELAEIARGVDAARGGDADAGQKAARALVELDARLEQMEADRRWPELDAKARDSVANASSWVSGWGTEAEQKVFADTVDAVERARKARQPLEMQRQLRIVRSLRDAAFFRHPDAWRRCFEAVASRVNEATDLPRAEKLVQEGQRLLDRGETVGLPSIVEQLERLLPPDAAERRLGFDSGLR